MTDENLRPRTWSPRNLLLVAVLVAVAFLGGFLWQYFEARDARSERDALRTELMWAELGSMLSGALIQIDNGGYENARQLMSGFFSGVQANLEGAPEAATEEFRGMLGQRDAVITGLSRSDPEVERALTRMYVRYRALTGAEGPAVPLPETEPGPGGATPPAGSGSSPSTARPG